ncbi:hypothetical protein CSOJ01_06248 [Colletotrichum sojae]|uniref:Uncharacterized protein n=1 Tax=Colletotrichum sojae TaxID=2175907 RepID=A0A8H6JCF4_9PEZI|nr:hypothetical protein CSOJ01_06248 [Colletotrichum sojae]
MIRPFGGRNVAGRMAMVARLVVCGGVVEWQKKSTVVPFLWGEFRCGRNLAAQRNVTIPYMMRFGGLVRCPPALPSECDAAGVVKPSRGHARSSEHRRFFQSVECRPFTCRTGTGTGLDWTGLDLGRTLS